MIKMRHNNNADAICVECGNTLNEALNLFDICIGGNIFTICDECNKELFFKTLKADCFVNGRVKKQSEINKIYKRAWKKRKRNEGKNDKF